MNFFFRLLEQLKRERNSNQNNNSINYSPSSNSPGNCINYSTKLNSSKLINSTSGLVSCQGSTGNCQSRFGNSHHQHNHNNSRHGKSNSSYHFQPGSANNHGSTCCRNCGSPNSDSRCVSPSSENMGDNDVGYQCLALNICPDLGERIMISGERSLVEETFPEISQTLMDARSGVAWNQDAKHVIRFPLNGYCKLNSLQSISRLLNHGFRIMASNGGGVEGQQFSEYLFVRKYVPM